MTFMNQKKIILEKNFIEENCRMIKEIKDHFASINNFLNTQNEYTLNLSIHFDRANTRLSKMATRMRDLSDSLGILKSDSPYYVLDNLKNNMMVRAQFFEDFKKLPLIFQEDLKEILLFQYGVVQEVNRVLGQILDELNDKPE